MVDDTRHPAQRVSDDELLSICAASYRNKESQDRFRGRMPKAETDRLRYALQMIPVNTSGSATLLDIGPATYWFPVYKWLGYTRVIAITKLESDPNLDTKVIEKYERDLELEIHCCDAEAGNFPVPTESVNVVCAFEVLEHFSADPMGALAEVNRILVPGGILAISTPNIASSRSIVKILRGGNPNNWATYATDPVLSQVRHHREYTMTEIKQLAVAAGMEPVALRTADLGESHLKSIVRQICSSAVVLAAGGSFMKRGSAMFLAARKVGPMIERYPKWLYDDYLVLAHP